MYIDEVPEGQTREDLVLIIKEVLDQRYVGTKNEQGVYVTPAFPKLIYVLDEDNIHEYSKYFWLTQLAAKCTSRRMVPDYISAKVMKELKYGHVYPCMGCVEGSDVVTYKFNNELYVEGFERMWDRMSKNFIPTEQSEGSPNYFMDLRNVEIYDKKEGFVNVKRIIRNLSSDWVKVKMSNGRVLVCTEDHPFHTINRGRVYAKDLIPMTDEVELNKLQYSENSVDIVSDLAWALGVFLSSKSHLDEAGMFNILKNGKEVLNKLDAIVGLKKSTQHIPNEIFRANRESRLSFLVGLIDASGHIKRTDSYTMIQIESENKELALQEMLLIQSLDIEASIYEDQYVCGNTIKIWYRVECATVDELVNRLVSENKRAMCIPVEKTEVTDEVSIGQIISVDHLIKTSYSYDVTTDSDHFDVSGIYSHNCRSFLTVEDSVKNDDGTNKFYGRFNQGVVTINLPDVALSSGGNFKEFWDIFDSRLELCHKALRCRHERLLGTPSDVAPILWQYGALARLKKGEPIDKLLFNGYSTISLGYAGLSECVKYMTGKSHTDPEATPFAKSVMQRLNDKCATWKEQENIAYSVYGSPIESTTYKFAKCLKSRWGIIPGITDKNYITNSYHIPVTEKINAFDKLKFEAPFQKLSPGGAISYIEAPNVENNIEAVIQVMQYIYDTILYAEINIKSDYCCKCDYRGEIEIIENERTKKLIWRCPNCGNEDQSQMSVARRTCGYIGSDFWNQGRTQEIKERVIHLDNMDYEW